MKQHRFDEGQIIGILKQQEAGLTVAQICRYRWKSKYCGMEVHEATRLRQLEQENARLKRLWAESMPDVSALKDVLSKKWESPLQRSKWAPSGQWLYPGATSIVKASLVCVSRDSHLHNPLSKSQG